MTLLISALIGVICFLILTDALSLRMSTTRIVSPQKQNLLNYVDGELEDIYVCPKSLSPLKHVYRCFGLFEEEYLVSEQDKDLKYCVLPNKYTDLTIKTEVERPVWALSVRERVGQNLFQTKLLPAIYERGYRQNFQVTSHDREIITPFLMANVVFCNFFPSCSHILLLQTYLPLNHPLPLDHVLVCCRRLDSQELTKNLPRRVSFFWQGQVLPTVP